MSRMFFALESLVLNEMLTPHFLFVCTLSPLTGHEAMINPFSLLLVYDVRKTGGVHVP